MRPRLIDPTTHAHRHVTVSQVADYFGVDRATVRKWIACGQLEALAFNNGRVIRINLNAVQRFSRTQRINPAGTSPEEPSSRSGK
jgi:excisionase family DNA binding protein